MTIGQRIKEARKAAGLTQNELAQRLNIKQATLSAFENDKTNIKHSTLNRISEALGLSIHDLLDVEDIVQSSNAILSDFSHWKNKANIVKGIEGILKDIYGHFEMSEASIEYPDHTASQPYFIIGTGKDQFVLYENDIEELYTEIKVLLLMLVDRMKDKRPIAVIERELLDELASDESTDQNIEREVFQIMAEVLNERIKK